jgi:DNA polymerase-3 subunit delta'
MSWQIIGHEWAVAQLRQSLVLGREAQSYLFAGPAGLGKALLALRLAQALNCEQGTPDPCLACRTCRRIGEGNHPDIRIAGMASQAAGLKPDEAARQKELKIATVREWQRDILLRPGEARRRVLILHDAERLNEESSNALLKTLEEPPGHVSLILVANSIDLLPTIVSRCRVLRLRPLPRTQVAAALEQQGAAAADAALLAAWSGGRIGWALQMLADPEELARRQERLELLLRLHEQDRNSSFKWAEQRAKEYRGGEQESVIDWLDLWQGIWRDVLLIGAGCGEGIVNIDRRRDLEQIAARVPLQQSFGLTARIGAAAQQLRENANPQLALENIFLHLPDVQA